MANLIYEVECLLDPDIVGDYDAWLPGHVRDVLACPGFLGAGIESPETPPGERQRRRVRYRVESAAALDHYLENDATRLRTETAQRFGGRVQCERRVFKPRQELVPLARESARCLNCGTVTEGRHCAQCGQAADVHVLSLKEVADDVTHSLLHLDSRVWRTLRLLVRKPGELTREFIAGRHQQYIPPFRLYLAVSILYFALSALLPESGLFDLDAPRDGQEVVAPVVFDDEDVAAEAKRKPPVELKDVTGELRKELAAEGVSQEDIDKALKGDTSCKVSIFGDKPNSTDFERTLSRACEQIKSDGGKLLAERFAANAPKLMFLFLPLIAAVAMLFYWRPRRLYAEHLVLFLHNHAFTYLLLAVTAVMNEIAELEFPLAGALNVVMFLLWCWLPYYVYRSMRVVYGNGRALTLLKFFAISTIYFVLLGVTMLGGLLFTMYGLS
ncbi:MAG TPA: DUF4286 family protein [Steroidobacteraceae bacterium]|nr:DUF4286 family protein [Steroidobacteraceae bacterium]